MLKKNKHEFLGGLESKLRKCIIVEQTLDISRWAEANNKMKYRQMYDLLRANFEVREIADMLLQQFANKLTQQILEIGQGKMPDLKDVDPNDGFVKRDKVALRQIVEMIRSDSILPKFIGTNKQTPADVLGEITIDLMDEAELMDMEVDDL